MARRRFRLDRIGVLLLGALVGFVLAIVFVYSYVNRARTRVVEERIRLALGLPRDAFELERIEPDGTLRILLRDIAFLDRNRDTILSAPVARARLITSTLNGGAIVFDDGEVVRPYLRLRQEANGDWNALQIFAVEAGGQPVRGAAGEERGRTFDFRGIRIVDGRVRMVMPSTPPAAGPQPRYASGRTPERVRAGGRWLSVHTLENFDANLALVRVKGEGGWRVEIGSASARVTNPDTRIESFAGTLDQDASQNLRFAIRELRTPRSAFDGAGTINLAGATPRYDMRLRAHPLDLRDLAGMGLAVPREGTARFDLAVETLSGGRTRWAVTDANVAILDSRASGRLTAITSPNADPVFTDTRLRLDPLRIVDLETLGFVEKAPLAGTVTGTLTSEDEVGASGGALRVDLSAAVVPRTTADGPPSTIAARGLVRFGRAGLAFDGLRVDADPLRLETLAAMFPENAAMLRGTVRGGATVSGTMKSLRIEGGDLAYVVGSAPETRLRGINGRVSMDPDLRFDVTARADPLALATLTQLFPSLPFRSATLGGPIRLFGTKERVNFDVDLNGAAGALAARGWMGFGGAAPTFDVSGRVTAFRPGMVVTNAPAAADSLSGTFSARGSTEDFRFAVDMTQGATGRFNLAGTVRRPAGSNPQLDVAGNVTDFQLGALLGRPSLLPGRVSGPIRVSGGGRQPYRFDIDLRGAEGAFALNGTFAPGEVPVYNLRGQIAGLDLSALPGFAAFPRTRLTGTILLDGRGTTPETFVGRVEFAAAPGSTIAGIALTTGILRVNSDGGVLRVDTLLFAGRGFRAEARGEIGLTRNAGPLSFSLNAPNLALLRPFVPGSDTLPDFAGSVALTGTATGTISRPSIGMAGQARGFRYGAYAAEQVTFTFAGAKGPMGWQGRTTLSGNELKVRTFQLHALTAEADLRPGSATFDFTARRDAETELAAKGTLELEGLSPYGVLLETMALRLADAEWRLARPAHVDWTADRGLAVDTLRLQRTGPGAPGIIELAGTLPPSGVADLRVHVEGVSLAEARRIFPALPDATGLLRLDAAIRGAVTDPRLSVDMRVDSLRFGGVQSDSTHLRAEYAAGRMAVNGGVRVAGREVVHAEASIPMQLSLGGIVPGVELLRDQPLTATLLADSVPLALVTEAFPAYVKDGAGTMRARVTVGGTPAHPSVGGDATLENATLTPVQLGATWTRINGRLSLRGDTIRVDSVSGYSRNGGRGFINGTVLIDDSSRPRVELAVTLTEFQVADDPDLAEIEADAAIRLSGRVPAVIATGFVQIEDGTIFIPSLNETREVDIVDADVGALGGDSIVVPTTTQRLMGALVPRNLRVTIGESVWLESPDARIQIRGDLFIDRPAQTNLIFGELDAVRGSYTLEFGPLRRQFDIVQGVVRFYGTAELNPSLDITAAHEVRSGTSEQPVTVLVHIAGTLEAPRVELTTSNRQPLTQSDLASLLLFGRTAEEGGVLPEELLSAVVLQEALANLVAAQIENALVHTGFVDFVRVKTQVATGTAGAGAASFGLGFLGPIALEVGKEITSNVYLTGEVVGIFGGTPQLGVGVDWQISPTLSLRAAAEPVQRDPLVRNLFRARRQVTVDLRRRWEYGRPRASPRPQPRRPPQEPAPAQPAVAPGAPPPPPPERDEIEGSQ